MLLFFLRGLSSENSESGGRFRCRCLRFLAEVRYRLELFLKALARVGLLEGRALLLVLLVQMPPKPARLEEGSN